MEEAQELCDRLLILDKGKVLDSGKPEALVRKSMPHYVKVVRELEGEFRIRTRGWRICS